MEIIDENKNQEKSETKKSEPIYNEEMGQNKDLGKIFGGLIIVAVGSIFLAREMGVYIPHWLFSWKMLLIAIGFYSGIKNNFQSIGWLIMILIGFAFLLRDIIPNYHISNYIWPLGIILVGLYIIVKPRSNYSNRKWNNFQYQQKTSESYQYQQPAYNESQASSAADEYIETSAVLGSVRKNVITKNFKGGEINCVFGGGEINMTQADFTGIIQLELNAVFGGMRLIVPSHWEIKSELTAVLGSVEDKRIVQRSISSDSTKFLILKGTAVFGGIEILSY